MESEPVRGRASLLTRARRQPWDSNSPLSAMRMNRPGRRLRLETNGRARLAETRALRPPLMDREAAEARPPARTRVGPAGAGGRDLRDPRAVIQMEDEPARAGAGLNPAGADGRLRCKASVFRWLVAHLV